MADDNDQFDQLAKLRAQLAQSRAACARLDKDNRSMRQSLRVPRFEELETVEQDVMLEHFLQVRFGSYDDEGEAGWELLRMLAQEPTWTPAVYDRSWAPSSVAEIRALAAETKGSRLATTLKKMCAMHRDYFLSAVLVPQPPLPPLDPEDEYDGYEYEYEPESQAAEEEEQEEQLFEYVPDDAEYLQSAPPDEPLEYVMDSDEDWGDNDAGGAAAPADPGGSSAAASEAQPSTLIAAAAGQAPGVVARWRAVTTHVQEERERKADQFRSVVEAEMERVKALREREFGPAGSEAPTAAAAPGGGSSSGAGGGCAGGGGGGGGASAAAEIGASRASWAPDYSTEGKSNGASNSSEGVEYEAEYEVDNDGGGGQQQQQHGSSRRQRREVDMRVEVVFPYAPSKENTALLVRLHTAAPFFSLPPALLVCCFLCLSISAVLSCLLRQRHGRLLSPRGF